MAIKVDDAIVLLGDSLTQGGWEPYGFAQRLSYVYARKMDVVNRGFSGYNSEWAIHALEQCLVPQHEQAHATKIRILIVWFGANDACLPPSPQHVPIDKFRSNLTHLIDMVKSPSSPYYSPHTRVILMTSPPINTHQILVILASMNPSPPINRKFDVTGQYAQVVRDVGAKADVPVVDVFSTFWDAVSHDEKALEKYLSDGLHLTAEGYTVVFDELIKTISYNFPELHYDKLKQASPPWDQVNPSNPRESLEKRKIDG